MSAQKITLPVTKGRTFTRETVTLDGKRFENCKFNECHLIYSGGPADCSACEFSPNTVWDFQGPAAITMVALQRFGWRLEFGKGETPTPIASA
jgi:hypothetical protein